MDMTGEYRIEAPRERVWQALNDPEVLKQCIPGCEELTKDGDDGFSAKVKAKVGPVSAKFSGKVTLSDIVPPESYTISGEGQGGAAGFAKGGAKVRLAEDGGATQLSYEVNAQVGGKLAQIGSRLIDGTAKKLAGQFFESFANTVGQPAEAEGAEAVEVGSSDSPDDTASRDEPESDPEPAARLTVTSKAEAESDDGDTSERRASLPPGAWVTALLVAVGLLALVFAID